MFRYLKRLLWGGHDDDRRHVGTAADKARMIEMDEPMAGAGAELDGEHIKSETEEVLTRAAAANEPSQSR